MHTQESHEAEQPFIQQYSSELYDESPAVKLVFLVIYHEQPICSTSISDKTRLSESTIPRALRLLLEKNVVKKKRSFRDPRIRIYEIA